MADICLYVTSFFCVLRSTYVAQLCAITVCYHRVLSPTYVTRKLSVWISQMYCIESQWNFPWYHKKWKREWGWYTPSFEQHGCSLNFMGVLHWKSMKFPMTSLEIKARMRLVYPKIWTTWAQFCEVCAMFLIKFWSFYIQFGCKYDRTCIWDGIVYHLINL